MSARRAIASGTTATILVLLTFAAAAAPKRVNAEPPAATVLCYHIVEAPAAPRMHITRDVFRQHLRYLEMTGYNVIALRDLYEYVIGKRASLPKNAVVITIDDGWASTYTEIFPEMQKRKFPFTVFIYPKIIGQTSNALTWKQIKEMSDAGVDIQSHSLSHPFLTRGRHRSMGDVQYAEWIDRELSESKRLLEKNTGKKVQFLAYPYGDYDEKLAKVVEKAGYRAALTCNFGLVRKGSNPFEMKRFVIDDRMDFAAFRRYLGANPMQIAEASPKTGKVDPAARVISAKIPKFDTLDPKSVGMALLSLGSTVPYSYDPRTGSISLVLQDAISSLKAKTHRAVVWATDMKTGKRVEATWVFKIPDPNAPPPAQPPVIAPVANAPATAPAAPVVAPAAAALAHTGAASGGAPKR